jgi:hypothetical protein
MKTITMMMPPSTPPQVQDLAERIARVTRDEHETDLEGCFIACLGVAFAYLAAIEDNKTRDAVIGELSTLAAAAVNINRRMASEDTRELDATEH